MNWNDLLKSQRTLPDFLVMIGWIAVLLFLLSQMFGPDDWVLVRTSKPDPEFEKTLDESRRLVREVQERFDQTTAKELGPDDPDARSERLRAATAMLQATLEARETQRSQQETAAIGHARLRSSLYLVLFVLLWSIWHRQSKRKASAAD